MYKEDYSSNNVENSVQNIETYLSIKNIELFKEIKENLRERISSYFLVKGKKEGEELWPRPKFQGRTSGIPSLGDANAYFQRFAVLSLLFVFMNTNTYYILCSDAA